MPKLTEGFSPITKPSLENPSISTNLITPVPIHGNNILDQSQTTNGKYFIYFSNFLLSKI
jgi:hypothetical protein